MKTTPIILPKMAGSSAERIVDTLRAWILQGRYQANDPLRQDTLAEVLGVSKIPLREALVQLKAEGLVAFLPNRGFVVAPISAGEVKEIYAMRVALETLAIETAIPHLTTADLDRAQGVLDDIDRGADRSQWGELNWQFHATLYQAAGMLLLLATIQTLHNNVLRYLILYLDSLSAAARSQAQHREILAACRSGKIRQARAVLTRHLDQAAGQLVALLS